MIGAATAQTATGARNSTHLRSARLSGLADPGAGHQAGAPDVGVEVVVGCDAQPRRNLDLLAGVPPTPDAETAP